MNFVKLIVLIILGIILFPISNVHAASTYGSGVYTNLCGSGTLATQNSCNKGCDPQSGSCSSSINGVVKYTCDGRVNECRSNESTFQKNYSFTDFTCGKTYQIDVFNKNCRSNNSWSCTEGNLVDYMTWYSGDCKVGAICSEISLEDKSGNNFNWNQNTNYEWNAKTTDNLTQIYAYFAGGIDSNELKSNQDNNYIYSSKTNSSQGTYSLVFQGYKNNTLCSTSKQITIKSQINSPTVTLPPQQSNNCLSLNTDYDNNSSVPKNINFNVKTTGNPSGFKFLFGDGTEIETQNNYTYHRYETSGDFTVKVLTKGNDNKYYGSSSCERKITLKPSIIESSRFGCSDITVNEESFSNLPAKANVKVNGYNNKGTIQGYKVDFGDGSILEKSENTFDYEYKTTGVYTIKAYVKNHEGTYSDYTDTCKKIINIGSSNITSQPKTGVDTIFSITAIISGLGGSFYIFHKIREN